MVNQEVSVELAEDLGINQEAFEKITKNLGRKPNLLELQIYSVMWSENVSYKSSFNWINLLPNTGDKIISGARQSNAGVVDIGNDEYCVFKMGTHNHPSGIDPYQGAATCVGDVCRDVVSVGAKPALVLNSLRFGEASLDRTKWLMDEVVKGIKDYSSVLYMENMGGEVSFNSCYDTNPIVNVMVAGVVPKEKLLLNRKINPGQLILLAGNSTGAEGVYGAEENFSIPKGNPGVGNSLIDCILKLNEANAIVRVENLDMAGIVNSVASVSVHANSGIDVNLNKIPLNQTGLSIEQVLLSRTQERVILVIETENLTKVLDVFTKAHIACDEIGTVTERDTIRFMESSVVVAELHANDLIMGHGAPQLNRKHHSINADKQDNFLERFSEPDNYWKIINEMVNNPNLIIKEYLQLHQEEEAKNSPSDAQISTVNSNGKALCFTISGNSVYAFNDPNVGAQINVARAVRRIICSGGKPLAINDCLNFGSPLEEKVFSQFVETIKGISSASEFFKTPVVGGNVSFYNESSVLGKREAINPTPIIGMLGVIDPKVNHMSYIFRNKGDMIFLIGKSRNDISGSEYLCSIHEKCEVGVPHFDLDEEKNINSVVAKLIEQKLICSAHSVERGGLFFNLIESSMPLGLGFDITSPAEVRKDAFLFGESQGRIVVSVSMENEDDFVDLMMESGVPFSTLGHVTKRELRIDDISYGYVDEYKKLYQKKGIK
ncbi:phosphoribosylformylglycinamidine synthase subunit PurL [Labilibaculum sp. DW002]|uniref:Phosphoribosylformylglycinamidine synthase subunit PurL n=1 Tax=Paralabilibaculum antarcticum TaxID=2912572 RepID=A0ABT5VWJ0_9BACT|nr:phosphoribosylformylglycinamidine synthase subunit PurL [Labilibaculum sp. DW002]MDE5418873.1 phosphoribosylformylglycinamidine synthase subunit PurL [Labilibaculum sp. DW002]